MTIIHPQIAQLIATPCNWERLNCKFAMPKGRVGPKWGDLMNFGRTYAIIPPMATKTPITDLSPTARPDVTQPRATMEQVLTWPTTVLDTGPVCAMMKNWDMFIMQANNPD
jgi:hypothetical protein